MTKNLCIIDTSQAKKITQLLENKLYWSVINRLHKKNILRRHGKNTILLASIPKSGNTYFRFIWLNIIFLSEHHDKLIDFRILDDYMPYEGILSDLKKEWAFKALPCLLKTHRTNQTVFKPLKAIHLFRSPLDTLISQYNYFSNRIAGPQQASSWLEKRINNRKRIRYNGDFSDFIRERTDSYCRHFVSWMDKKNCHPVSYEVLKGPDAATHFRDLLKKLHLVADTNIVKEAIRRSQPERLKDATPSSKMARLEINFIRDARIRQFKEKKYFNESDIEYIYKKLREYNLHAKHYFPDSYQDILDEKPWEVWKPDKIKLAI